MKLEQDIIKYLSGNSTPEERYALELLLEKNQDAKTLFANLENTWKLTNQLQYNSSHTEAGWLLLEKELDLDHSKSFKPQRKWITIAASITLILGAYFTGSHLASNSREIVTTAQMKDYTFSEKSKAEINKNTSIKISKNFGKKNRNLLLERGDIYLEVTKNKALPFKMETKFGTIEVLGTKFSVSANHDYFKTELNEGRVKININEENFVLLPGRRLEIIENEIIISNFNKNIKPTWDNDKNLVFDNASLADILQSIEKAYNKKFSDLPNLKLSDRYTCILPKNNLSQCIEIISKLSNHNFDENISI